MIEISNSDALALARLVPKLLQEVPRHRNLNIDNAARITNRIIRKLNKKLQ